MKKPVLYHVTYWIVGPVGGLILSNKHLLDLSFWPGLLVTMLGFLLIYVSIVTSFYLGKHSK